MAEAIAHMVLGKLANTLADATIKEVVFLRGARDKLSSLERELRFTKAFIKDAELRSSSEERMRTWVSEVWDVAYRIEDVVETFVAKVKGGNRSGKVNILKQNLKYPLKLPTVHKLTSEMDKINATLLQIKQLANDYGIKGEFENTNSSAVVPRRPDDWKVILPDEDDLDNIVGLQKEKEEIVKQLLCPDNDRRRVVSIVGQGGLGKTTLAKKVFYSDEVKKRFKYRIWLSISQQYSLQDLLKTMLERTRPLTEDEKALLQNNDQRAVIMHFLTKLKEFFKKERYLVIMDDVWTEDLWNEMENALPDVENGSRVLVTTRSSVIARKADPTCKPYNLSCLSQEESQQLLLKKAFPNQDLQTFPPILSDLPKQFGERCDGLPLALLVVGGLLSIEEPSYSSWYNVLKRLSWRGGEGKIKCTDILATSYQDLPFYLKPCFMYFGLFPEDHEIKAKSLIRMWVAEGFIPIEDERTMEETAEDYLKELIRRSMIQVSQRYIRGSIRYCRIHDLMRDLAILKGRENRFLEIISSQDGNCSSSIITVRRVALHCDRDDIIETMGPNLRSLLFFEGGDFPHVKNFNLMKILNWESEERRAYLAIKGDTFKEIVQLRYIQVSLKLLPLYGSSWWSSRKFRRGISRMRNLQTLQIEFLDDYVDSSDCIWDIKTLRHVILPTECYGPPSEAHLPNLQTLKFVKVRKEWVSKGWPTMPNIRVLKLWKFPHNYGELFHTFLCGLHHLTSLRVETYPATWEYEIRDLSVFPWSNLLESLLVGGKYTNTKAQNDLVPRAITTSSFPVNLIKLQLWSSKIQEDPMPVLEKLESLRVLDLRTDAYEGRQLSCSPGGFPCLQFLTLVGLKNLEEWKADVAEGAMPVLKVIIILQCPQLRLIPGLRHMTSLTKFTLRDGSDHLRRRLDEDESHKIGDGHSVDFNID